jgi:hypothetical protein
MRRKIQLTTRREVTTAVGQRYQAADRIAKKLILDEFTKITGYHRKHAIRVLTARRCLRGIGRHVHEFTAKRLKKL